jgi:thiol:disulfide interchange protein DsbA
MRRIQKLLLSLLLLSVSSGIAADQSLSGLYNEIRPAQPTRTGDKVEVLEVFFYGCIHCYNLEPHIKQWLEVKPEAAEFHRMPVIFRDDYKPLARAYYTAEKLAVLDRIHLQLFHAIHEEHRPLVTDAAIREFFIEQGIDSGEFDRTYNSNEIRTKVRQAEAMARRYMISSIPTIVVNGKYSTSPSQARGQKELFQVINQLVEKETGGK